ncbi:MAG: methylated-DNA--[protein]-cysteine S-methyltransferase [Magnetococcales bacterium]|nr:methylated-DNA--[protein]-cysteine S-methyltransferase [Magnetococcales bacterium]
MAGLHEGTFSEAALANTICRAVCQWLDRYARGEPCPMDLPLQPAGTSFQKRVWKTLLEIPQGEVRTYGQVADLLDTAPRAIGQAVGANPIPVLIPCHRVVAAQGLGGYSGVGGVNSKQLLLQFEKCHNILIKM